ncbi:esterase-like activity of phytase family protein [Dyella sp.]|uniref:esterase-like activity of phytase family protein n=1 Tax=Dyella sp. TaxID=1869338 RepID=UPI002ED2AF59
MKQFALCLLLAAGCTGATAMDVLTPHVIDQAGPQSFTLQGRTFVNQGLVGTGRLPAGTVDFLGDTLGSFSSLAVVPRSWKRVGDHYEATLWTLPDRGRNDPSEGLFYDYAARLHRFRLKFKPYDGKPLPADIRSQNQVSIQPDGGLVLTDFRGQRFTGADPAEGTTTQKGILLPSPRSGTGAGKVSMDAESLQFTHDGHFYIGDEYGAHVYYFDAKGRLQGVLVPPAAVVPRTDGKVDFGSLNPPQTGRRNNQGVEGMGLSPDGTHLFVTLQSALIQDSARGDASGRINTRVLVYDVSHNPVPDKPVGHYVMQLPAYNDHGNGKPANKTAAQSEIRVLNEHQFLMLSRDGNGLGTDNDKPIVYKSILLVDTADATNLAGSAYETTAASVLRSPDGNALKEGIKPAAWYELVNLLNRSQLSRFGLNVDTQPKNQPLTLSEKWEAMDLVPVLDPAKPQDYFLFVGNDNDFIARHCVMDRQRCDSSFDNDNMLLVYRLTLPSMQQHQRP